MIEKIIEKINRKKKAYKGRPIAFATFLLKAGTKKIFHIIVERLKRPFYNTKIYKNKERERKENLPFFKNRKYTRIQEPVSDLYLMQHNNAIDSYMESVQYDAVVRYMAIENYYGEENGGFELYNRMNVKAGVYKSKKQGDSRTREKAYQGEYHSEQVFRDLIESYENNGYMEGYPVWFDKTGLLINGSHRFALALYRNQEFIDVNICNWIHNRRWSLEWFWGNGFQADQIEGICCKEKQILDDIKKRIGSFYCILYPPAERYFEDITYDIKCIDRENIKVLNYQDYWVSKEDFLALTTVMYHFDSISKENLLEKQKCIVDSSEMHNGLLQYRVIELEVQNPKYHLKPSTGVTESVAMVRLKTAIRARYSDKVKKSEGLAHISYPHDIIIHSTDNYISNNAYRQLCAVKRDISECFLNRNVVFRYGENIKVKLNETEENPERVYKKMEQHFDGLAWMKVNFDSQRIWCDFRGMTLVSIDFI